MKCKFYAIMNENYEVTGSADKHLSYACCYYMGEHRSEQGEIDGVIISCDLGHGYGFDNGSMKKILLFGEELQFSHDYTDTSDGTWEDGSTSVRLKIVPSEEEPEFSVGHINKDHWKSGERDD